MLVAATIASVALVAAGSVDIRSAGDCPSAADVRADLQPLLPAELGRQAAPQIATVTVVASDPHEASLDIQLVRADASLVGHRRLFLRGSCTDMAATIATILAAWVTDPSVPAQPEVTAAPSGSTRSAAVAPAIDLVLSAGGGVVVLGGVAAGATAEARVGAIGSRWQGRASIGSETSRTADLGPGTVAWQHTSFALGVAARRLDMRWLVTADAGAMAGWMTLQSDGLDHPVTRRSFEYGATGGLRVGRSSGRWSLWIEGRANLWVAGQRLLITGFSAGTDLPVVELAVSLGGSVRARP